MKVQHPEEVVSGTDDEEVDYEISEPEPELEPDVAKEEQHTEEIEEPELDTLEEREQFYHKVRVTYFCGGMQWNVVALLFAARGSP